MPPPLQRMPGYTGSFASFGDAGGEDPAAAPVNSGDPSAPAPEPTASGVAPLDPSDPNFAPTSTPPMTALVPAPPASAAAPVSSARTRAGAAVVLAGIGLGAGFYLGKYWGAGSGVLFAGATMNAYRAKTLWSSPAPADHSEAVKSTIMTVIGLGAAGYLGYKAYEAKKKDA